MSAAPVADTVRTVSFDGDGTLWDLAASSRRALERVVAHLDARVARGAGYARVTVDGLERARRLDEDAFRAGWTSLREARRDSFRRVLRYASLPEDPLADELLAVYYRSRAADVPLYDDVKPCLDKLHSAYALGLASSGNTSPDAAGLGERLAFSVVGERDGLVKCSPHFFDAVIERAGVPAHAIVHVGDSLEDDVEAAVAAGCRAVWLRRRAGGASADPAARVPSLASLRELPATLRRLER